MESASRTGPVHYRTAAAGGVDVFYREAGPDSGPVVLLLHGFPSSSRYPGVQTREISPWQEDGQTWGRLHATFPASITTHSAEQVFYFGADGLPRRLDYTSEANAGDPVAHYTEGYKTFDRLPFPTRRRVYRRNPGSSPDRSLTAITLDIHAITAA